MLALLHAGFPKYFDWKKESKSLSQINRQMLYVHAFFIALVLLMMGILCVASAGQLTHTDLGKKICLGLGVFWLIRLVFQLFIYSPQLWKGKKFETAIHVIFSLVWSYLSAVFFLCYLA